ncbi:Molybdopterin binding domain protein [uncultured delta proteobacterium]|uniref:Molybdopterin binding domain protein n=1 Tax=uncultured delta proteobacterium TaxID=34034 RepID=A0A212KDU5_9DELT|nr:Molybdopterin binding domain protein [uncultured delta proteobacterium]
MGNRVLILPTGDEIRQGVVLDTDSPMIREVLTAARPGCDVTRAEPAADDEETIAALVAAAVDDGFGLIVLIGGSGGGHRHSPTLARDVTHSALDRLLEPRSATSLYGWNGHLWSRLICGRCGNALVINVPGPYQEAKAAMEAFAGLWGPGGNDLDLEVVNSAMASAVCGQYGIDEKPVMRRLQS